MWWHDSEYWPGPGEQILVRADDTVTGNGYLGISVDHNVAPGTILFTTDGIPLGVATSNLNFNTYPPSINYVSQSCYHIRNISI